MARLLMAGHLSVTELYGTKNLKRKLLNIHSARTNVLLKIS